MPGWALTRGKTGDSLSIRCIPGSFLPVSSMYVIAKVILVTCGNPFPNSSQKNQRANPGTLIFITQCTKAKRQIEIWRCVCQCPPLWGGWPSVSEVGRGSAPICPGAPPRISRCCTSSVTPAACHLPQRGRLCFAKFSSCHICSEKVHNSPPDGGLLCFRN